MNVFHRTILIGLLPASMVAACSSGTTPSNGASGGSSGTATGNAGGSGSGSPDAASATGSAGASVTGSSGASATGSSGVAGTSTSGNQDASSGAASAGSTSGSGTSSDAGSSGGSSGASDGGKRPADASAPADAAGSKDGSAASPDDSGLPAHTGTWHITPIGDSITGSTCGPQLLSQELIKNGHTNFTFVGGQLNNQGCSGAPNVQSEGHGGYLVTDLLPPPHKATLTDHSAELPVWAMADKPDVLLMQFGTNDVWNNVADATILSAYTLVLNDFRSVNPNVVMFVAQITPLNPAGCGNCETQVEALNAAIPAWATSMSTAASPIFVVNVWSAFTASMYIANSTNTLDGVHPNPAGSALVAQKWYDALLAKGIP